MGYFELADHTGLPEREKTRLRERERERSTCGSNKMATLPLPPRHVGDRAFLLHSLKSKKEKRKTPIPQTL